MFRSAFSDHRRTRTDADADQRHERRHPGPHDEHHDGEAHLVPAPEPRATAADMNGAITNNTTA
jgi:hypothetical protein